VSAREELARLVAQHRLGVCDPEDLAAKAYLIGIAEALRPLEAGSVFRILRHDGKPFDRRAWTASGPANLSLRHGPKGGRLQEGKVVWLKEDDSE